MYPDRESGCAETLQQNHHRYRYTHYEGNNHSDNCAFLHIFVPILNAECKSLIKIRICLPLFAESVYENLRIPCDMPCHIDAACGCMRKRMRYTGAVSDHIKSLVTGL